MRGFKLLRVRVILIVISVAISTFCRNGSEPLNYYGLTVLQDQSIGNKLGGRFKAKGQPVFLVHDPNLGLSQGDIMRFQDKAVLIDADVWQTLNDEGALSHLKVSPLVRVQAKATVPTWETRAKLVTSNRDKKVYQLGAELLKILEDTFGGIPSQEQIVMVFDGPTLVLLAPEEFLDQLKYSTVRRVPAQGIPRFVSLPPEKIFTGQPILWQAWAADPSEPAATLRYSLFGDLPKGLTWDATTHTLKGSSDLEGQWHLLAEARNKNGLFDTLSILLTLRNNKAPTLAQPPKLIAIAGQLWSYDAEAVDADHEGSLIKIKTQNLPAGMTYDSLTHHFQWYPADSNTNESAQLEIKLEDPLGANNEYKFPIKTIPATDMLWSEGIKPTLPWDTLQEGKSYHWEAGASAFAWAQQGISLSEITGPDSIDYRMGSLRFRPMRPGPFTMTFIFDVSGKRIPQTVTLPVRPDKAPHFESEVGVWRFQTGEHVSYRPIAIDDEGDPVFLSVELPSISPFTWDGKRLYHDPEKTGTSAAHFFANDPAGHGDEQWIAYHVEKAERPVAWLAESRLEDNRSTLTLTADFGTGRLGLFTPDLNSLGVLGSSGQRHWPFLFFGGNLLGRENEREGKRLWLDAGITLRFPNSKVATGGIYGRMFGTWTFPEIAFSKVELEMVGYANQALVVADTSNLQVIFGDGLLEFAQKYSNVVNGIIEEATAKDNMVLCTRFEAYSRLGLGFWAGPGIYRVEIPNEHKYYQRIGSSLRYEANLGQAIASHSLRLAWGTGGAGWGIFWNGHISYNAPF